MKFFEVHVDHGEKRPTFTDFCRWCGEAGISLKALLRHFLFFSHFIIAVQVGHWMAKEACGSELNVIRSRLKAVAKGSRLLSCLNFL
jgi:hypothetical protein